MNQPLDPMQVEQLYAQGQIDENQAMQMGYMPPAQQDIPMQPEPVMLAQATPEPTQPMTMPKASEQVESDFSIAQEQKSKDEQKQNFEIKSAELKLAKEKYGKALESFNGLPDKFKKPGSKYYNEIQAKKTELDLLDSEVQGIAPLMSSTPAQQVAAEPQMQQTAYEPEPMPMPSVDMGYQMGDPSAYDAEAVNRTREAKQYEGLQGGMREAMVQSDAQHDAMIGKAAEDAYAEKLEVDKLTKDVSSAKVDQGRFWANKSTGDKILAVLAAGLSGYASAGTGGKNNALEMINNAIEQDLKIQEQEILGQREGLKSRQGILADMYKKLGDMDAAKLASRKAIYDHVDQNMEMFGKVAGAYSDANKANQLKADFQLKAGEVDKEQLARLQMKYLRNMDLAGQKIDPLDIPKEYQASWFTSDSGYIGNFAGQPADASKFRNAVNSAAKATAALDKLIAMSSSASPISRIDAENEIKMLIGTMRESVFGPGAMSETEAARAIEMLPPPTDFARYPGKAKQALMTVRDRLKNNVDTEARLNGLQKVADVKKNRMGFTPSKGK